MLQQLVAIKAVALHGCVKPAVSVHGGHPTSDESRRELTSEAFNIILQHMKAEDEKGVMNDYKLWSAALTNSDGVNAVLGWVLRLFQTHDEEQVSVM